jgi:hypothetical protein
MASDEPSNIKSGSRRTRVFISYARSDAVFTDRLEMALKVRGIETLIDRRDITPGEEWERRIRALIVDADAVVFVISPNAVVSASCLKEVDLAASLNKRIQPIVYQSVSAQILRDALRRPQRIFFVDEARFDQSADELVQALSSDIEWVRKHTEFGAAAQRWEDAGRPGPGGLLLRPPLLTEAEAWIGFHPRNAPEPTEVIRAFITLSREAFDQEQAAIAASQANLLAQLAEAEGFRGNPEGALRLAMHAARRSLNAGRPAAGASAVHAKLASAVQQSRWRLVLNGHEDYVYSAAFSPDGQRIVTGSSDKTARIWDVHFAVMAIEDLVIEACTRRLRGISTLTRYEMSLAGYPEEMPLIDVCKAIE